MFKFCKHPDCDKLLVVRGYCRKHYVLLVVRAGLVNHRRKIHTVTGAGKNRNEYTNPHCDHKTMRCECVNPGKPDYKKYLEQAGIKYKRVTFAELTNPKKDDGDN